MANPRAVPAPAPEATSGAPGAGGSGPRPFGSWGVAAASTTLLAVSIALGPLTGVVPIALASLAWTVAVGYFVVDTIWRRWRSWSIWHWLFVAGVGAALVRLCSLGLVQHVRGRQSLFWNIDWRYAATLAHSISRFSGVSDSIDYAGEPVRYHAGPSWIAGSLDATMGAPVNFVLFLVVPAVSVVVIGVGAYRLLRAFGAPSVPALVAVAVALNLPRDPVGMAEALLRGDLDVLAGSRSWAFTASLILNGLLGLAVGFSAGSLLMRSSSWGTLALGGAGLAALAAIKPQYLVAFGLILGIAFVVRARRDPQPVPWPRLAVLGAGVLVLTGVFSALNPQASAFTGLDLHPFEPLAEILDANDGTYFSTRLVVVAIVCIGVFAAVRYLRRAQGPRLLSSSLAVAAGALVLYFVLDATTFLVDRAQLRRVNEVGLDVSRDWMDPNFSQAMLPVTLLVVMVAVTQLTVVARGLRNPLRVAGAALVVILVVGTLPTTVSALRNARGPAAHESAEEAGLSELIDRVETTDGVWLSSDLADSADGFAYPLLGVSLTALGDAQYYLADVVYVGRTQEDVVERVRNVRRFFSEAWSPWHEDFLRDEDIRHVIVRDRCPPVWDQTTFPGSVVGHEDDWTLLEVGPRSEEDVSTERIWPEFTGEELYGGSACLDGPFTG